MDILSSDSASDLVATAYSNIFRRAATLPARVFHPGFVDYRWMEFEMVLDYDFWECLKTCAHIANARKLYVASTDPDNVINFGHTGVVRLAPTEMEDDYHRMFELGLPESPEINIGNIGEQLLFFDESFTWGFCANRGIEVAVGARSSLREWPSARLLSYLSFDSMLGIASGPYRKSLPPAIRAEYIENYG